ncbi:hypothetical protein GCM10010524_13820 [Streptomyces mexicanus]
MSYLGMTPVPETVKGRACREGGAGRNRRAVQGRSEGSRGKETGPSGGEQRERGEAVGRKNGEGGEDGPFRDGEIPSFRVRGRSPPARLLAGAHGCASGLMHPQTSIK